MKTLSLPSGPYQGQPLDTVPESVLVAFYKNRKFKHPDTQALKQAIRTRLLNSKNPHTVNEVYLKDLAELLITPQDKQRQQEARRRQNLIKIIQMFNHSPNHGFNGSLDVEAMADKILTK
jgi:hypothetical protein